MSRLGSYRRIFKQDYSEEIQPDIETLSITVNDSFEAVYDAMNNNVTFTENINCTIVTFTATVGNNGAPIAPITLKLNNFQRTVIGMWVINAVSNNNLIKPNSGVYIDYTLNNNITASSNALNQGNNASSPVTIKVNNIIGLPSGTPFTITAIII